MMDPYPPAQLTQYLTHISFPNPTTLPPPTLPTLRLLAAHHLASVPFESLSLHYSPSRRLTLDRDALFTKIVTGGGAGGRRGGYCMEVNTLLACVLKGLGYDVCSVGARISFATDRREGEGYGGWSHMANIITIESKPYLLDLGFGANTPLTPLPFPTPPSTSITVSNRKLALKPLLSTSHPSTPPSWIYSHRASPDAPWTDAYALAREEFHAPDFGVMNLSTMTDSIFTRTVVCVRTFRPDEAWFAERAGRDGHADVAGVDGQGEITGEIAGQLVLAKDTLKYRVLRTPLAAEESEEAEWSADVPLATFTSDDERVEALRTYFDVRLSDKERRGIVGTPTALGAATGATREGDALAG